MYFKKTSIKKTSIVKIILIVSASTIVLTSCGSSHILDEDKKQGSVVILNEKIDKGATDVKVFSEATAAVTPAHTPTKAPAVKKDDTKKEPLGAVILKGDKIYIYKEQTGEISEVAKDNEAAQYIGLSPLKDKLAFTHGFGDNDNAMPAKIGIYNIKDGKLLDMELDESVHQLMEVYWSGDNTITAVGHINPSANMYQCFDAQNGNTIFINPVSSLYDATSDGRRLIYYFTQHFGERQLPGIRITGIHKDSGSEEWIGEPLYKVSQAGDEISFAKFYDGDKKIIFGEYIAKEKRSYVNFADINRNSISMVKRIPLEYKLTEVAECRYLEELSKLVFIGDDITGKKPDQTAFYLNILDIGDSSVSGARSIAMESELYKQHRFDIRLEKGRICVDDNINEIGMGSKTTYVLDNNMLQRVEQQNREFFESSARLNEAAEKFFGNTYDQSVIFF